MGDSANPRIWDGATVFVAPVGTAAPVDVTTPWSATWKDLGLLSEDGGEQSVDNDSKEHYGWGGKLIRVKRSKYKNQLKITPLEDNVNVWALINPGSVASTAGGLTTRTYKNPSGSTYFALGLELNDGTVVSRRIYAKCEVSDKGTIKLSDSDLSTQELTIMVYPDANGLVFTEITNDPQAGATAAAVPKLTSVDPNTEATAGGGVHVLVGLNFTGVTAVSVGGQAATSFRVYNDSILAFVAPARTAGAKPIVVTNGTGASTDVLNITYS